MFVTFKSCAGLGLVLATLATPALAQTDAAADTQASSANAQIVVRDAATGKLRAPTAEEARALQPKVDPRAVTARMLPRLHASGARGARLTDATMSYSVLVRQADGSLQELCFQSREEAEAAISAAPASQNNTLPTE